MNEFLIKSYINKLTIKDIENFSISHELNLSKDELNLIMKYIKRDYHKIIYEDPSTIFDDLKMKLDNDKYQKIKNLYMEFKGKYKNYL